MAGKAHIWKDNGTIVQRRNPDIRMIFLETENLEDLFSSIENMLEVPIGHIVVESTRRGVKDYIGSQLPPLPFKFIRRLAANLMTKRAISIGVGLGLGAIETAEERNHGDEDDYYIEIIRYPRSITMYPGELLGAFEALQGRDAVVDVEKLDDLSYRLTVRPGEHPLELQGYLSKKMYPPKPGDVEFERCTRCNTPIDISRCKWDFERGAIYLPDSGNRVSFYGPDAVEAVFGDLEAELGEDIPEAIIEAQSKYVKKAMIDEVRKNVSEYRYMLALRGLGYIKSFESNDEGMEMVIQNPCLPQLLVGTVKGLYELMSAKDTSSHAWTIETDGDLTISVKSGG